MSSEEQDPLKHILFYTLLTHTVVTWNFARGSVNFLSVCVDQEEEMVSLQVTLQQHGDEVCGLAFSSSLLASCSADKTLRLYSAGDFSEMPFSPLSGHGYGVHSCCFSACGRFLLSCSTDGSVIAWSCGTGEEEARLQHPDRSPLRVCALAPDGALLLAGAIDGSVALWDFPRRTIRRYTHLGHTAVCAAGGQRLKVFSLERETCGHTPGCVYRRFSLFWVIKMRTTELIDHSIFKRYLAKDKPFRKNTKESVSSCLNHLFCSSSTLF